MRPAASIAVALLLGACTVQLEGAPCESDANCPSGQGCGSDGTCSAAALACPGHDAAGECRPGTTCGEAGERVLCTASGGPCSTRSAAPCPAHQSCQGAPGSAACACAPTRCSSTISSYCEPGDAIATCARDTSNAAGCWYASAPVPCAPAQACQETGGVAACQCPAAGAAVGQGCPAPDARGCSGTSSLRCAPAASGSPCLVWQVDVDCAASGLVCASGACQCPAPSGGLVVADAASGSPAAAIPAPSGASAPTRCRFATLGDALAAATAAGASTVRASGWTASLPDGVMTFAEAGPLSVPAGVVLTTDENPPTPGHYVIRAPATPGAAAFLTLAPGATISGLVLRNEGSTSAGIASACAGESGTVTIRSVRVLGTGSGSPPARLGHGIHHAGACSLDLQESSVSGAGDSGLFLENVAPAASVTVRRNTFTGNDAATDFLVGGTSRRGGGVVILGTLPAGSAFRFQGNLLYSNAWDQLLAYTSGALSLAGGTTPAPCGADANFFGCYAGGAAGVGISSVAASVDVSYDRWQVLPPVPGTDYVGTLTGTNLTCPAAVTCPP